MQCLFPSRTRGRNTSRMTLGCCSWARLRAFRPDRGPSTRWAATKCIDIMVLFQHLSLTVGWSFLFICLFEVKCNPGKPQTDTILIMTVLENVLHISSLLTDLSLFFLLFISYVCLYSMSLMFWRPVWNCSKSALSTLATDRKICFGEQTLSTSAEWSLPWWVVYCITSKFVLVCHGSSPTLVKHYGKCELLNG